MPAKKGMFAVSVAGHGDRKSRAHLVHARRAQLTHSARELVRGYVGDGIKLDYGGLGDGVAVWLQDDLGGQAAEAGAAKVDHRESSPTDRWDSTQDHCGTGVYLGDVGPPQLAMGRLDSGPCRQYSSAGVRLATAASRKAFRSPHSSTASLPSA